MKTFNKIISILIIIIMLTADFSVLGTGLKSYAATSTENVKLSAYFINANGEKVEEIDQVSTETELTLYISVSVENEGYFNGDIELTDSNFSFITDEDIDNDQIISVESNKISLKQINAGETTDIEVPIEMFEKQELTQELLTKQSTLTLTGTYVESKAKSSDIEIESNVTLNVVPSEDLQVELETSVITNSVILVGEENKRVIQLLIKSRVEGNAYPVDNIEISVQAPFAEKYTPESVEVMSLGTYATNNTSSATITDFTNSDGDIQFTISNAANENNLIQWVKDSYDQFVITYIYDENIEITDANVENYSVIATTENITLYDEDSTIITGESTATIADEEVNVLITQLETSVSEMYKGQLYANVYADEITEIPYKDTTTLYVTSANVMEDIMIAEDPEVFVTETEELEANSRYVTTEINKAQMLDLLGDDGEVHIVYEDTIIQLNQDSETNEAGNIVITYDTDIYTIAITTSAPVKAGTLKIRHNKVISANDYELEELKEVTSMKKTVMTSGIQNKTVIMETNENRSIELKETTTKAELTIVDNTNELSTLQQNKMTLGINLVTESVQYDLFTNPVIEIQLPDAVESFTLDNADTLYAEGFTIVAGYDVESKVIQLILIGQQTEYPSTAATQVYLQLELTVDVKRTEPSQEDKIIMYYENQTATQYYESVDNQVSTYTGETASKGYAEQSVTISSLSGVLAAFDSSTYEIETMTGVNVDTQNVQVERTDVGKEVSFEMAYVNNTDLQLSNVRILGVLPTAGTTTTTYLNSTLKSVDAENATIYYTENAEATADISDDTNGWTTTFNANAKMFLIVLNDGLTSRTTYEASYTITLPTEMPYDVQAITNYKLIYDTETSEDNEVQSATINFITPVAVEMDVSFTAEVGNDTLKTGDTVKVGEVIRYTMSVTNKGIQAIQNIVLQGLIPSGTVLVEPVDGYEDTEDTYYEEISGQTEKSATISQLGAGETYTVVYEVRVNENVGEISNKLTATCEDTVLTDEITNYTEDAKIRVTVKTTTIDNKVQGYGVTYVAYIENLTSEEIQNLKLKFSLTGFSQTMSDIYMTINGETDVMENSDSIDITDSIEIDSIPANDMVAVYINGVVTKSEGDIIVVATAEDEDGNIYRSNKSVEPISIEDVTVELTSASSNNMSVEQNTYLFYYITVTNTGDVARNISVNDEIPEYMEIVSIIVKGDTESGDDEDLEDEYLVSNDFTYNIYLEPGQSQTIEILVRILNIVGLEFETLEATNKATITYGTTTKESEEFTVYILGVEGQNYNIVDNSEDGDNSGTTDDNTGDSTDGSTYSISGIAWIDENKDGEMNSTEDTLEGVRVRLYDVSTNNYLKDSSGKSIEKTTDASGNYTFLDVPVGEYIVLFDYDTDMYELTTYQKSGVSESANSDVILKNITVNGTVILCGVTDTIELSSRNISNISIGLIQKEKFDLELNKYVTKVVVQNSSTSKTYTFDEDEELAKVEIAGKQINNSTVIIEYKITVTNTGDVAGYVSTIVDYLPSGTTFNSELNTNWYLLSGKLYTKELGNEKIQPGETKEVTLTLTKKMTEDNVGLINNRAEIYEDYNEYGISDTDSTPNNQMNDEDDIGSANLYIGIKTGATTIILWIVVILTNMILIGSLVKILIMKNRRVRR